jgi:O-antigen/teichoic acid export membrane protein
MATIENSVRVQAIADTAVVPVVAEEVHREKDIRRLAAGASTFLGGRFIGRGFRLMTDIALAHILGPAMFGLYAIGWTLMRIITSVCPMGLDSGVVRFGTRHWRKDAESFKGVVLRSLFLAFSFAFLIGAGFYLAAPWIAAQLFHKPGLSPVIRCFAFVIPLVATLRVASSSTRITRSMKYATLSEDVSQPAGFLILILVFYWMGWRMEGALEALVISFGVALLIALYFVRRLYPEVASSKIKAKYPGREILAYSLPTTFSAMIFMLVLWLDRLFVGHYRSAAETGIYQAASQLSISLAIILSCFGSVFSPMTADLHHRGEIKRLGELFRVSTKWALYVSLAPFLVMCFAPREVMTVIFGTPYEIGWLPLVILGIGQLVNAGTGPVTGLMSMAGLQNPLFYISAVSLCLSAVLNVILIPRLGMAGAAISTAVTITVLFAWAIYVTKRKLGIVPYDRRYLKGLVATAVTVGALLLVGRVEFVSPTLRLVAISSVAFAVFGMSLKLAGLDQEDRDFIKMLRVRLKISEPAPQGQEQ